MKIAYVNVEAVLAASPAAKAAEQQWITESQRYQAELNIMLTELDSLNTDYEVRRNTLTPQARLEREQLIQQKDLALTQRRQELENEATQRQMELVAPVYEQIGDLVEAIRAEGGYALILDSGSQAQAIIAADPAFDLTDLVISRLTALPGIPVGPASTRPGGGADAGGV